MSYTYNILKLMSSTLGTCIAFLLMNIYCRCNCIHLCDMCLFPVGWEDYRDHTAVQCRWGHHSVYRGPCGLLQQLPVLWQYGSLHHLLCRVTRCTGSWEGNNQEECDHPPWILACFCCSVELNNFFNLLDFM